METDKEMIRVHVVPRKHCFDPSLWTTKHTDLRGALLERLMPNRVTDAIPCLAEGLLVHTHADTWADGAQQTDDELSASKHGLWVGRSRFQKAKQFVFAPPLELDSARCPARLPQLRSHHGRR